MSRSVYDSLLVFADVELQKNPRAFTYVDIEACLPNWEDGDSRWHEYARWVTARDSYGNTLLRRPPQNAQGLAGILLPRGLLQLCLLHTEPFSFAGNVTTDTDKIRDVRPKAQLHACQDRSKLIETR